MGIDNYLDDLFKRNTLFLRNGPEAPHRNSALEDRSLNNNLIERYSTDYFCGSQVAIFLGDIWLSDISMIQYEMTQTKRPFYGYKSQKFDMVAKGAQLINGAFSMNYTHTNYLNMAIAEYLRHSQVMSKDGGPGVPGSIDHDEFARFLDDIYNKRNSLKTLGPNGPLTNIPGDTDNSLNELDFSVKANLLEQYFWGAGDAPEEQYSTIPPDNLPPFDVLITFGNYAKERPVEDEGISSHTAKILNSVHITGHALQTATTGEPIQEVYSFIARGLDSPLTRVPSRFILKPDNSNDLPPLPPL
jgi:hypothetical protein